MSIEFKLDEEEYFFGHKGCGGCGGSLAVRIALKVLGENTFVVVPAGCMSAVGFVYPQLAFGVNALISPFASTGAMLSGVATGAKALGLKDVNVVGFAGDGGTADIGLQALSGAIDRDDNIIYICYDNEAYMNTGVQQSSLTQYGASTTTSPAGERIHGSTNVKKDMFDIVAAHKIKYAATYKMQNNFTNGQITNAVEVKFIDSKYSYINKRVGSYVKKLGNHKALINKAAADNRILRGFYHLFNLCL
jgi:pyruvate ferredoxin oxidoreductase beta subunit